MDLDSDTGMKIFGIEVSLNMPELTLNSETTLHEKKHLTCTLFPRPHQTWATVWITQILMRTTSYLIGATFCFLRECMVTLTEQVSTIALLRTKVCTVAVPMKLAAAKFSRTDFLQKVL